MLIDLFERVMSVSVSLSVMIALLLLFSPYIEKRYSCKWWRYIWLVISLRSIFFFRMPLPIADKVPTTINVDLKSMANTQILETDPSLLDTNGASVWSAVFNYFTNLSVLEVAALIWVSVAFLRGAFCITEYYKFRKTIMKLNQNIVPESMNRILIKVKDDYHINKKITLAFGKHVPSPMLTGFFSPLIILPMTEYAEQEIEFIFRHELMHLKQNDIWLKGLLFVSESIHWFNPIIRIAFRKANHDIELECDANVIKNQGGDYRKAYSVSLLEIMKSSTQTKNFDQSASFTTNYMGGKEAMQKRFKNILDRNSKKEGTALLIMVLLMILILSGLIACSSNRDGNPQEPAGTIQTNDRDTNYYLNRNESVLFQEACLKFAKAYFSSDQDEIKELLADGVEPEVWNKDVYQQLSRLILKWNPEELATDKNMEVQYEFVIEGEDTAAYLGMILKYQNEKWIVQEYYLEQ